MTAIEKLRQDHPDWDEAQIDHNIRAFCPSHYFPHLEQPEMCGDRSYDCFMCWDREVG